MYTSTPFLGKDVAQWSLNDVLQRRTGLSDAAKGLDPKALQSSTMIGVEAIINWSSRQPGVCCKKSWQKRASRISSAACSTRS